MQGGHEAVLLVPHDLRQGARVRHDDGQADGEGLVEDVGVALPVAHQSEDVRGGHVLHDGGAGEQALELHAVGDLEVGREGREP